MEATGPPAKMAEREDELTPMLSQYYDLTVDYGDALVLFQVGDFYELFCEAAEAAARTCEITLTKREDSTGTYPMAGVPIDNAAPYVETLLNAGYRVAIADQVEEPEEASGVVERAVTRVVTPGTVVEDELLEIGNTYVAALVRAAEGDDAPDDRWAVAFVDVSTGEFRVTSGARPVVQDELDRFGPAELVTAPDCDHGFGIEGMLTPFRASAFDRDEAADRLGEYAPAPEAVVERGAELRAAGALLAYAEYTQGADPGGLTYISRIARYDPREGMQLDATALRSLEVFENREGGDEQTLRGVLDETSCALGRRELSHWLRRPLVDRERIAARHDAVAELARASLVREEARELLRDVYDVERLITRVSRGRANARDLRSLKATLDVVPELKATLADVDCAPLGKRREALDELDDVRGLIGRAIVEEPPIEITEGGVVREGFDEDLDAVRATEREGRQWVADLERRERERTGIDSLKVGHNEVHGYYIEVTNPNVDRVPDDYTRRQTLKNSERFYTPELKEREDEILGASERADAMEYQLFTDVRSEVAEAADRVQAVAETLAELDVLCTLAAVAVERDYVRPEFHDGGVLIEAGRHPVVETTEPTFVPNGADLREKRFAVITGPNMSGKSTYMRQIALIQLLAQVGSFVPADAARLPVVDRVFTRVGASDDIAGGRSTFMREMTELTEILHGATADSLVLLDEVGRGTSTTDGRSIAWAVSEFIHDEIGATTLFATHYHELTRIAERREGIQNLHFTIDRDGEEVAFLHSVVEGASAASYGVEVARLAGVPETVIDRSRELITDGLPADDEGDGDGAPRAVAADAVEARSARTNGRGSDESDAALQQARLDGVVDGTTAKSVAPEGVATGDGSDPEDGIERTSGSAGDGGGDSGDGDGDDLKRSALEAQLTQLDVADMTPLEALNWIHDAQREIDD